MILNILIFIAALFVFKKINSSDRLELLECKKRTKRIPLIAIILEILGTVALDVAISIYCVKMFNADEYMRVLGVFALIFVLPLILVVSIYVLTSLVGVTSVIFANWCCIKGLKVPTFYKVMTLICCFTSILHAIGMFGVYVRAFISNLAQSNGG